MCETSPPCRGPFQDASHPPRVPTPPGPRSRGFRAASVSRRAPRGPAQARRPPTPTCSRARSPPAGHQMGRQAGVAVPDPQMARASWGAESWSGPDGKGGLEAGASEPRPRDAERPRKMGWTEQEEGTGLHTRQQRRGSARGGGAGRAGWEEHRGTSRTAAAPTREGKPPPAAPRKAAESGLGAHTGAFPHPRPSRVSSAPSPGSRWERSGSGKTGHEGLTWVPKSTSQPQPT